MIEAVLRAALEFAPGHLPAPGDDVSARYSYADPSGDIKNFTVPAGSRALGINEGGG